MVKRPHSQLDEADELMSERVKRLALGPRSGSPQFDNNGQSISAPPTAGSATVRDHDSDVASSSAQARSAVDSLRLESVSPFRGMNAIYRAQANLLRALHFERVERRGGQLHSPD